MIWWRLVIAGTIIIEENRGEKLEQILGRSLVMAIRKLYKRTIVEGEPAVIAGTIDMKIRHWKELANYGLVNDIKTYNDFVALSNLGVEIAEKLIF